MIDTVDGKLRYKIVRNPDKYAGADNFTGKATDESRLAGHVRGLGVRAEAGES